MHTRKQALPDGQPAGQSQASRPSGPWDVDSPVKVYVGSASLSDWRGKMAAPEEQELSQAQTEKLLQFQVRQPPLNTETSPRLLHARQQIRAAAESLCIIQAKSVDGFFFCTVNFSTPDVNRVLYTWSRAGVAHRRQPTYKLTARHAATRCQLVDLRFYVARHGRSAKYNSGFFFTRHC